MTLAVTHRGVDMNIRLDPFVGAVGKENAARYVRIRSPNGHERWVVLTTDRRTPLVRNFNSRTATFLSVKMVGLSVRSMMHCVLDSPSSRSSSDRCDGLWRLLYGFLDNKPTYWCKGLLDHWKKELGEFWWDGLYWHCVAEVDHWRQRYLSYRLLSL